MPRRFPAVLMLAVLMPAPLGACAMFGPPSPLEAWKGKSGAEVLDAWGEPGLKSPMANGGEEWIFTRTLSADAPGYWRDETRTATREVTGADGKMHAVKVSETFPVWQAAGQQKVSCTTRFMLKAGRVAQVSATEPSCAEPEKKLAPAGSKAKAPS